MAEAKQTTIRFSEDMYRRLEAAGEVTGLPINSIVVVACLEWLDAHQPERSEFPWGQLTRRLPSYPALGAKRGLYPFERFSGGAKKAIAVAQAEAERAGQQQLGDEHLLLGLLQVHEGRAAEALKRMGVGVDAARSQIDRALAQRLGVPEPHVKKVVQASFEEAVRTGQSQVGTEHLLLGLLSQKDATASNVLNSLGVTIERLRTELERLEGEQPASA